MIGVKVPDKIAIYPGTFDPITLGHLDILQRASKLFDSVIITLAINSNKKPLFSREERLEFISDAVKNIPNVTVDSFEGMLIHFAVKKGAIAIIRGLRAISDFEFEFQLALMNRKQNPEITTVFLMPNEKYTYLNSSIIREVSRFGGDVSSFITPLVAEKLKNKFLE
jgi:pantetheine-phosphate adenylyltransferase